MRQKAIFTVDDPARWKERLLHWVAGYDTAIYLDSNGHPSAETEVLAACGAHELLETQASSAFATLKARVENSQDWWFGFFAYDLKNELEQLSSAHFDGVGMPDLAFFRPEQVFVLNGNQVEIQSLTESPESLFEKIAQTERPHHAHNEIRLQPRIARAQYLETVEAIRRHILAGDIYEMNFCQEFYAENAFIDPLGVFKRLNTIGNAPFSAFARLRDRYLLCASPERFLQKKGRKILSQPIKGTRKRGQTQEEDERIRRELAEDEKDRAENVMIVDLVRNDFSRHCLPGTVKVEELCGIHSFATVHQMISTIVGTLPETVSGLDALRDAFPMGSMTGAPKVKAMELIERYEQTRRGLYSGALGYIDPKGDFDFNVVIRSILYHENAGYVSAQVGGAIVFDSVPELEYEECLVKAAGMFRALGA